MTRGFVFGKFLPFHIGHEELINFALKQCDQLSIIVCCSNKEEIPGAIRKDWILETFKNVSKFKVLIFDYDEKDLANTSVASEEVSSAWAAMFQTFLPGVDLLITSEPYGEMVARYMNIQHKYFDPERILIPVSASLIRNNIVKYWQYLPDSVKPYYSIKIVILGTESTGKSTMVDQLSKYYNCSAVKEAGHDIISDSTSFSFDDLHRVAFEHSERIKSADLANSPIIIIDTDIHITESYGHFCFDKKLNVDESIRKTNKALLYLYLCNDVEHVQDGTRLSKKDRDLLDKSHRKILSEYNIPFVEISGNWADRIQKAKTEINKLLTELSG